MPLPTISQFARWTAIIGLACATPMATPQASAQTSQTQTFTLQSGWNLIQFQVLPANADPAAVFAGLTGFSSVWNYDAGTRLWQRYVKSAAGANATQQANDATSNNLLTLSALQVGKAYWVNMAQTVSNWTVTGIPPLGPVFPTQDLPQGWNMVGFPIGATTFPTTEKISLLAVLTAAGFDYDAILTWEAGAAGSYRKMFRVAETVATPENPTPPSNPLAGLPPELPFPSYTNADLQRGYWLHVTDPAVLRPRLLATVRPDIDAEPLNNFPSQEDIDVQDGVITPPASRARRTPRTVKTQDFIRFFPGEDTQTLSISNVGDPNDPGSGGGGIMIWKATWTPVTDGPATPDDPNYEHWVRLFTSPAEKEIRNELGKLVQPYNTLQGVTTLENDIIYLRLDRKNLGRGVHTGILTLETSVGTKSYTVRADIDGLQGDWKGYAVIQTVNGKRNPVPDIDLAVSFYEDRATAGYLRGIIDSSNALLWPVDVPLVGYRVADQGNKFVLGGGFVLPPGDQNAEPFDEFPGGGDIDFPPYNQLNVKNPFPFPIQRTVSFDGALMKGNPSDGYVLEGGYSEIIHGMTKDPLRLLGTFRLERQSVLPFATRRALSSDTGVEPVILKGQQTTGDVIVGAAAAVTTSNARSIAIGTEMDLQSLQISLGFASGLPHTSLRITLTSPGPDSSELVVYDGSLAANAVTPKLFESITFPRDRPFAGNFASFLASLKRTKCDPGAGQLWKLTLQNTGTQPVTLKNWSLRLEGQPVSDVVGVLKDSGGLPVTGATVTLNGVPFSAYAGALTDAQGGFTFKRLPLLPLNFSAVRPGYLDPAVPGLGPSFTKPFSGVAGLSPAATTLISQFNPLAGAPANLLGVPGFSGGTTTNPFQLVIGSQTGGPVSLLAGPLYGMGGIGSGGAHQVDFFAVNAQPTVSWKFGDGTPDGTGASVQHAYPTPGWYQAELRSPAASASPQVVASVIIMPTVRSAPATPAAVGGKGPQLAPDKAASLNSNYVQTVAGKTHGGYIFQPFFSGGGSLPASRTGGQVGVRSQPDVYTQTIDSVPVLALDAPAAKVTYLTLQHCYASSADIDLAPAQTASHNFRDDDGDGLGDDVNESDSQGDFNSPAGIFTATDFDGPANVNNQGFKQEDFNYSIVMDPLWNNTRLKDQPSDLGAPPLQEFNTTPSNPNPIAWGDFLQTPAVDWAIEPQTAAGGGTFTVATDDPTYHRHQGTSTHDDYLEAKHKVVTHYKLACFVGGSSVITLTAPSPAASIKLAKDRHSTPDNPLDPELTAAPGPTARNLYYTLQTGGLASQPVNP